MFFFVYSISTHKSMSFVESNRLVQKTAISSTSQVHRGLKKQRIFPNTTFDANSLMKPLSAELTTLGTQKPHMQVEKQKIAEPKQLEKFSIRYLPSKYRPEKVSMGISERVAERTLHRTREEIHNERLEYFGKNVEQYQKDIRLHCIDYHECLMYDLKQSEIHLKDVLNNINFDVLSTLTEREMDRYWYDNFQVVLDGHVQLRETYSTEIEQATKRLKEYLGELTKNIVYDLVKNAFKLPDAIKADIKFRVDGANETVEDFCLKSQVRLDTFTEKVDSIAVYFKTQYAEMLEKWKRQAKAVRLGRFVDTVFTREFVFSPAFRDSVTNFSTEMRNSCKDIMTIVQRLSICDMNHVSPEEMSSIAEEVKSVSNGMKEHANALKEVLTTHLLDDLNTRFSDLLRETIEGLYYIISKGVQEVEPDLDILKQCMDMTPETLEIEKDVVIIQVYEIYNTLFGQLENIINVYTEHCERVNGCIDAQTHENTNIIEIFVENRSKIIDYVSTYRIGQQEKYDKHIFEQQHAFKQLDVDVEEMENEFMKFVSEIMTCSSKKMLFERKEEAENVLKKIEDRYKDFSTDLASTNSNSLDGIIQSSVETVNEFLMAQQLNVTRVELKKGLLSPDHGSVRSKKSTKRSGRGSQRKSARRSSRRTLTPPPDLVPYIFDFKQVTEELVVSGARISESTEEQQRTISIENVFELVRSSKYPNLSPLSAETSEATTTPVVEEKEKKKKDKKKKKEVVDTPIQTSVLPALPNISMTNDASEYKKEYEVITARALSSRTLSAKSEEVEEVVEEVIEEEVGEVLLTDFRLPSFLFEDLLETFLSDVIRFFIADREVRYLNCEESCLEFVKRSDGLVSIALREIQPRYNELRLGVVEPREKELMQHSRSVDRVVSGIAARALQYIKRLEQGVIESESVCSELEQRSEKSIINMHRCTTSNSLMILLREFERNYLISEKELGAVQDKWKDKLTHWRNELASIGRKFLMSLSNRPSSALNTARSMVTTMTGMTGVRSSTFVPEEIEHFEQLINACLESIAESFDSEKINIDDQHNTSLTRLSEIKAAYDESVKNHQEDLKVTDEIQAIMNHGFGALRTEFSASMMNLSTISRLLNELKSIVDGEAYVPNKVIRIISDLSDAIYAQGTRADLIREDPYVKPVFEKDSEYASVSKMKPICEKIISDNIKEVKEKFSSYYKALKRDTTLPELLPQKTEDQAAIVNKHETRMSEQLREHLIDGEIAFRQNLSVLLSYIQKLPHALVESINKTVSTLSDKISASDIEIKEKLVQLKNDRNTLLKRLPGPMAGNWANEVVEALRLEEAKGSVSVKNTIENLVQQQSSAIVESWSQKVRRIAIEMFQLGEIYDKLLFKEHTKALHPDIDPNEVNMITQKDVRRMMLERQLNKQELEESRSGTDKSKGVFEKHTWLEIQLKLETRISKQEEEAPKEAPKKGAAKRGKKSGRQQATKGASKVDSLEESVAAQPLNVLNVPSQDTSLSPAHRSVDIVRRVYLTELTEETQAHLDRTIDTLDEFIKKEAMWVQDWDYQLALRLQ
ncbi:hypothetical protein PCE1_002602 [Barthelona sp. PCE]